MEEAEHRKLIEAVLFMSPNSLNPREISEKTGIASVGMLETYLKSLIEQYRTSDTSLQIINIGGKFMFSLKEPYASKVGSLASGPDLSRQALRVLAYISKNDGILQSQLVRVFGSSTYDYMKELKEKEFVETAKSGRSKKIMTTIKFKEYFNV